MPCVCGLEGVLVEGFLTVYHISSFLVVCCVEYQTLVGLCKSQLLSVPEWKQLESKHEKGIANVREEPLLPGFELATFRSRVRRITNEPSQFRETVLPLCVVSRWWTQRLVLVMK